MLEASQPSTNQDGADEWSLVLMGDTAASWEILLELLYERCTDYLTTFTTFMI